MKMQNLVLLILVMALWAVSVGIARESQLSRRDSLKAEQYAIYDSIIEKLFIKDATEVIIIDDLTFPGIGVPSSLQKQQLRDVLGKDLYNTLMTAFRYANKEEERLTDEFRLAIPHELQHVKVVCAFSSGLNPQASWDEFFQKYPKSTGAISLSRIGFGPDGQRALVYVHNACGFLCSNEYLIVLKKTTNWQIGELFIVKEDHPWRIDKK